MGGSRWRDSITSRVQMSEYVHAMALGVDPALRRLAAGSRGRSAAGFLAALDGDPGVVTETYSLIGRKPGIDLLIWRMQQHGINRR